MKNNIAPANVPAKAPKRAPGIGGSPRQHKLAQRRYALSLPVPLASRLEALAELYPHKGRSQLISDLVGIGLAEVEKQWAQAPVVPAGLQPDGKQPVYLLTGPFSAFHGLVQKHHLAMEHDWAKDASEPPYQLNDYSLASE